MLIAAMDVSGVPNQENYKFLSIVLGTEDSLRSLHRKTGLDQIHMSQLSGTKKDRVKQALSFDGTNRTAYCVALDRDQTIFTVRNNLRIRKARIAESRVYRQFDRLLKNHLEARLSIFLSSYGISMSDLTIECDTDSSNMVRNWSMAQRTKGIAHQISDAVAYCNNRRWSLDGVQELDFRQQILDEMYYELLK